MSSQESLFIFHNSFTWLLYFADTEMMNKFFAEKVRST